METQKRGEWSDQESREVPKVTSPQGRSGQDKADGGCQGVCFLSSRKPVPRTGDRNQQEPEVGVPAGLTRPEAEGDCAPPLSAAGALPVSWSFPGL